MQAVFVCGQTKRRRALVACMRCRQRRIRCSVDAGADKCHNCLASNAQCQWPSQVSDPSSPQEKSTIYANNRDDGRLEDLAKKNEKVQYICATQPLAALLSKDALLSFDGAKYGLFYPWRYSRTRSVNPDLRQFVLSHVKNTLNIGRTLRRKLIELYLTNCYPFLPVVDLDILNEVQQDKVSPLLVHAMMLVGARYCDEIINKREFSSRLYEHCQIVSLIDTDKITLIQAYLLMTIHEDGDSGAERARQVLSQAIMLIDDLGITNLDSGDITGDSSSIDHREQKLFRRIFWTSLHLDRYVASTSGRAKVYDVTDLCVNDISASDFENPVHYCIFHQTVELARLNSRVLDAHYRPPPHRAKDETLAEELASWHTVEPDHQLAEIHSISSKLLASWVQYLDLCHSYTYILFLRCQISSISHFERPVPRELELCREVRDKLFEGAAACQVQTAFVIHSILHVAALCYVELMVDPDGPSSIERFERCIEVLQKFEDRWWLAAASVRLCRYLQKKAEGAAKNVQDALTNFELLDNLDLDEVDKWLE